MIATLKDVTFTYPRGDSPALSEVSLSVDDGSFSLLAGPSAGGKSTLLRLFNGLIPQFHGGTLRGKIEVGGHDPTRTPARQMAGIAGMVFQEPEAQAIAETVEDDIAFTLEQHGVAPAEMHRRVDRLLATVGIEHLRHRRLATLSGGERQRSAIAAVLALEPRLLLLDEPTSQLDPGGAAAVIEAIERLHAERGITVLLAEHRLERLLPVVDGVIEVEGGLVRQMTPREGARQLRAVPAVSELGRRLRLEPLPLTVDEALASLNNLDLTVQVREAGGAPGDELLVVSGLTVAYGEHVALRNCSLSLREGEIVALVGANGSGKSTLFRAIAGLIRPVAGEVRTRGEVASSSVGRRTAVIGLVPQDPAIALYHETVGAEVEATLRVRGAGARSPSTLQAWGLTHVTERNPRDLSVGQQQRVAIAAMLAHEPPVWMLDEPTRGADAAAKAWLAERLRAHAARGGAAIVATHDMESAAQYATRAVGLENGEVVFDLPARTAFGTDGPLATQTARCVPGAITPGEVSRR